MRKLFSRLSPSLLITTLALGTILTVPAFAEDGSNTASSGSGDSPATSDASSPDVSGSDTTGSSAGTGSATQQENEAHGKTVELLQALRQDHKEHTEAQRKLFCDEHKIDIASKFSSINTEMNGFQSRIDAILAKAESYQQTKNITVANWSALVAAATSAQTTSADALAALKNVTPSLDCTSTTVAQDVATFKTAAQSARDDLKAYKTAVQALIKALLDTKSTNDGSNQ